MYPGEMALKDTSSISSTLLKPEANTMSLEQLLITNSKIMKIKSLSLDSMTSSPKDNPKPLLISQQKQHLKIWISILLLVMKI
jgi:hypothetical protein